LLQPSRLNVGNATAKQSCGFDQLRNDRPATWFFRQMSHFDPKVKGADMHATFEHHHYKWSIAAA
jgi:hypothetical protein